jgi:hypothetical protein
MWGRLIRHSEGGLFEHQTAKRIKANAFHSAVVAARKFWSAVASVARHRFGFPLSHWERGEGAKHSAVAATTTPAGLPGRGHRFALPARSKKKLTYAPAALTNFAFSLISTPASACETGQFFLAVSA